MYLSFMLLLIKVKLVNVYKVPTFHTVFCFWCVVDLLWVSNKLCKKVAIFDFI